LRPWKSSPEIYRRAFDREQVRTDFRAIGLETPEALWARQLASQRTAFAIAGDGPRQSDAFPILEYEAPKAFFVGASAVLFSSFDERTWQADLAAPEKEDALESLDVSALRKVFGQFTSVNEQLYRCLVVRFEAAANRPIVTEPATPSLFHTPGSPPVTVNIPDNASEEWRGLLEAMAAIQTNPASWPGPVATIQTILTTHKLDPRVRVSGQSPMDLAALAAKVCLRHGDRNQAKALVLAGLKIDPRSPELLYIGRIVEREPATAPADSQ